MHLEFIVKTMNINENLAGVTIFAFGNGCTDLFSTLAAMETLTSLCPSFRTVNLIEFVI